MKMIAWQPDFSNRSARWQRATKEPADVFSAAVVFHPYWVSSPFAEKRETMRKRKAMEADPNRMRGQVMETG